MKETKKQIKAQLINELSKKYEARISDADGRAATWHGKYLEYVAKYNESSKETQKLREENESMKEKLAQYEEWINRMQEFCNLPEEERLGAVKKFNEYVSTQTKTGDLLDNLQRWIGYMFV